MFNKELRPPEDSGPSELRLTRVQVREFIRNVRNDPRLKSRRGGKWNENVARTFADEKNLFLDRYLSLSADDGLEDDEVIVFRRNRLRPQSIGDAALSNISVGVGCMFTGDVIVDFANKWPGGGVLRSGAVQEEILFLRCPELLVLAFIVEVPMRDDEAIIVENVVQVSKHIGYRKSLRFGGAKTPTKHRVIVMDAPNYNRMPPSARWVDPLYLLRKATAGYELIPKTEKITTGLWGCGVYGGDPMFAFIMQWVAWSLLGGEEIIFILDEGNRHLAADFQMVKNRYVGSSAFEILRDILSAPLFDFSNSMHNKICGK